MSLRPTATALFGQLLRTGCYRQIAGAATANHAMGARFLATVAEATDREDNAVVPELAVDSTEVMRLALVEAAAKLAPRYEAIRANPFPPKVQAWIHEFQTARPYTIEKLNARIFSAPLRVDLMHRAVIWQRDGMRQGTHSTKGISDIRGTTRKAAPQKGGGRARVGTYRAPQFRGGATVFGPQPRDHSTKLQHKVQLAALRSALSTKYMQDELILVDALQLNTHKTREFVDLIQRHNWSNRSVLLTTGRADIDKNLTAASKNLQAVTCTLADDLDVYRMLQNDLLVLDRTAVRALESKLQVD